ncbi:Regulatory protein, ArsR [Pseudonocardia sp. Ae168_Ps1]|uniref:ArsR/SmtB family transcription factor n=1 Tax=unclassified Pseudonocardia TaxID=2619320 RepID=UPI0006CB1E7A|nr:MULTISPECIES: metalloregulator ArsR/SmtB family transcription factor [unclassified Pseudonocardia]ALE73955.1 MarR family transcriptional regulator [Pseudonocardia sp. EC080625-04]ALL77354.1 MarR family transcriptional regulator [Pseudonocardia sp. EC080610-09]ALL80269.1 MarR family transcriptional regulator [Pseudonocardia sp. EC080619-01]OLL71025.1 Regulatory protein, ArsR [Pseudonocardia sp. Ae168_Ps1]
MHKVPEALSGARVIDPDQVCDAVAVLADGRRVADAATVLDVLGEANRLSILLALQHAGDLCVSDLAVAVGMSDSAVSHALRLLRAHGMVTAHRQGRLVRYRLTDGLARRLLEVVSAVAVTPGRLHAHGAGDEDAS